MNQCQLLPYERTVQLVKDLFSRTSTDQLTFYGLHARLGKGAMDDLGILPHYTGCAVHDHWKSPCAQRKCAFSREHGWVDSHHLRELIYLAEQENIGWAKSMVDLLLEAKKTSESTTENCLAKDSSELASILLRYDGLLEKGLAQEIPLPTTQSKKKRRGRPKQSKAKNLLDRLRDFKDQVLAFLVHPRPFFEN